MTITRRARARKDSMTFQQTKLGFSTTWMVVVAAIGLGTGISGAVPVLWVSAAALIPAALGYLMWQEPPRTVSEIIHDADASR
jgi:hypothetical protein